MSDLGGCREKHKRWTAREYLYSKALIIHRYKKMKILLMISMEEIVLSIN